MAFGTNTTLDNLTSRFQYLNMSVKDYGEERLADGVAYMMAAHEAQVSDIMADLAGSTTERLMMFGTGDTTQFIESEELTSPPPQKPGLGAVVGFPLKKYTYSWQGSRQYFLKATVGEIMGNVDAMLDADLRNMIGQFRQAVFNPTNYTFSDDLVDHITATPLPVKRLLNADGLAIPPGPNGESFTASSHTHYLGTSSFAASDLVALKETVLEHYQTGEGIFCIPRALATTIAGFTGNFVPLTPTLINPSITSANITGQRIDTIDISNREIGLFDGIPVWIKPWMPAGVVLFTLKNPRGNKVCMVRTDPDSPGLNLAFEMENFPLRAKFSYRDFGIGVWERAGAAVLDVVNSSYTTPTVLTY